MLLVETNAGQQRVVAATPDLEREGVRPGMRVADARALCGDGVRLLPHDPVADAAGLEALARWGQRFSPVVGVDVPPFGAADTLLFDATGCDHLHGGERPMLHGMHEALRELGFRGRLAMADTIGVAWAVCCFGRARTMVVPPSTGLAAIRALPIEALRLRPAIVETLRELGVKTIDQLERLPRSTWPARFGTEIAERFDAATGERPDAITSVRPLERLRASRAFEPPLSDGDSIEYAVTRLLEPLLDRLRSRREGVVRMVVRLKREEAEPLDLEIGCARGLDDAGRLRRLIALRLEGTKSVRDVERVGVEIVDRAPLGWRRTTLFGDDDERATEYTDLVEQLSQRLGEQAVLRPRSIADAQPERSFRFVPALRGDLPSTEARPLPGRPLSLLQRPVRVIVVPGDERAPERFTWKGKPHVVGRSWGPERIATGWWRGRTVRRDYHRVETETGHRFWLFRCGSTGEWFLHGTFD